MPSIMPAFIAFPREGAIIGRLLTGYGEIEYLYAMCLASAVADEDSVLRAIFSIRGEKIRLDVAHELMRASYETAGLSNKFNPLHAETKFCLKARNTFSHCHWEHDRHAGLFYVNLEQTAARKTTHFNVAHAWRHVDKQLLATIEEYFVNTARRLQWVAAEYRVYCGKVTKNIFRWPRGIEQPMLHNPPDHHNPPWINEDPPMPEEEPPGERPLCDDSHQE